MKKLLLILLLFSSGLIIAQNKEISEILNEGKLLFRMEKGSWYGTDDMLARFSAKRDSLGGYLSYETTDHKINTIFYSRFDIDKVLIRYQFDSIPKPTPISVDTLNTDATVIEKSLIALGVDARERVASSEEGFFSFFENTAYNFIPLIQEKKRVVYILTGPQISGVLLIGNDYKLTYNKKNVFKKKEKIHNSLLQFAFKSEDKNNAIKETIHSHVMSKFISSTDICTLLLYKDYLEWKQHIVISDKEVSVFDLESESLYSMKKKAWEKISDNQSAKND